MFSRSAYAMEHIMPELTKSQLLLVEIYVIVRKIP